MSTGCRQVEHRANVQAADRGVAVERAVGSVPGHDLAETARRTPADARARRRRLRRRPPACACRAGPAAAAAPPCGRPRRDRTVAFRAPAARGTSPAGRASFAVSSSALACTSARRLAAELDQHQRLGLAHDEIEIVAILEALFGQPQDQSVEQFGGRGLARQDRADRGHGVGHRIEVQHQDAAHRGQRQQVHQRLGDRGQAAFGADDQLGQVEVGAGIHARFARAGVFEQARRADSGRGTRARTRRGCSRSRGAGSAESGRRSRRGSSATMRATSRWICPTRSLRACCALQFVRRERARMSSACRRTARRRARSRCRRSCRARSSARRPSCCRSCRRGWRGCWWPRRGRTASRAARRPR